MIVITDSNIFISALITPSGVIASILTEKDRIQFLVLDLLLRR
jgi:predicted nucleic acid-binding protein